MKSKKENYILNGMEKRKLKETFLNVDEARRRYGLVQVQTASFWPGCKTKRNQLILPQSKSEVVCEKFYSKNK